MREESIFVSCDIDDVKNMITEDHSFYAHDYCARILCVAKGELKKDALFFQCEYDRERIACLYSLIKVACDFPETRIHIVMITSYNNVSELLKLNNINFYENSEDALNHYFELDNGSRIYIIPLFTDKGKNKTLLTGVETNIIYLQNLEELDFDIFHKAYERVGTHRPDNKNTTSCKPFVVATYSYANDFIKDCLYPEYELDNIPDNVYISHLSK